MSEVVLMNADNEVWVVVEKITVTGKRYVPNTIIGQTGKVIKEVTHHGVKWKRVLFKSDPKKFSTKIFGNVYYDFLDDEIVEIGR